MTDFRSLKVLISPYAMEPKTALKLKRWTTGGWRLSRRSREPRHYWAMKPIIIGMQPGCVLLPSGIVAMHPTVAERLRMRPEPYRRPDSAVCPREGGAA